MGARVVEMEGFGHCWMLQDPVQGAAILEQFWANVRAASEFERLSLSRCATMTS